MGDFELSIVDDQLAVLVRGGDVLGSGEFEVLDEVDQFAFVID